MVTSTTLNVLPFALMVPVSHGWPPPVGTAHKFALANSNISGEMIEAGEFSGDASEFGVSSVPHIVINGDVQFVGARSDEEFAQFVLEAYNHSGEA